MPEVITLPIMKDPPAEASSFPAVGIEIPAVDRPGDMHSHAGSQRRLNACYYAY